MANIIPALLIHRLRNMEDARSDEARAEKAPADDGRYNPTPVDIVIARIMLTRAKSLPPDLVDSIFDYAEYWAHSTNAINYNSENRDHLRINGSSHIENKFLLRSYPLGLIGIGDNQGLAEELAYDTTEARPLPLVEEHGSDFFPRLVRYPTPRLVNPARKIVFSIRSKDQGHGGDPAHRGTHEGSWTWFEAGLERFDASQTCDEKCTYDVRRDSSASTAPPLPVCGLRPVHPAIERAGSGDEGYIYVHPLLRQDEFEIHRNKTASREWQEHSVTWSYLDDIEPDSESGKELDEAGRGRNTGDGSFVSSLRLGDVVTVWGKARFPLWVNHVESVKIDLYWAV